MSTTEDTTETPASEVTAFIGIYRVDGEDGIARFKCSEFVHASEACVMRSIPIFEGTEFLGVFPIQIDPLMEGLGSGMIARIEWEKANPDA